LLPQRERFAGAIAAYMDEVADGNILAVAGEFQVSRRTIRDWKKGVQIPQLASLSAMYPHFIFSPRMLLLSGSPAQTRQ
jgi:hypothetical protein